LDQWKKNGAAIGLLAGVYFLAGKIGLTLAFIHPSSTAVWPPTGIALAALLILGRRVWPGIFLGAFLVNLTTVGTIPTSIGIATGNTLEALIGASLVAKFAGGRFAFFKARDTFRFAFLAGLVSCTVAASVGVTSLSIGGFAKWADFRPIWLTWWLGDTVGAVTVAPVLVLWTLDCRRQLSWWELAERIFFVVSLALVGEVIFCGLFLSRANNYPIEYLCIPFLVWAAFRFGQRDAATATLLLALIASWGTLRGFGPFVHGTPNESLLLLQTFMGVVAIMTIALAAVCSERQRAEDQARHLAVTDPLTGLANYRRLIDILDSEIKRSDRTGRPFSVLLLDLDGLKKINDRYGHLTGSRALCRTANILRVSCRNIDLAARYGGDEFALVIPEADATAAQQVTLRICEQVSCDTEQPPISASAGYAVYPVDGATIEELLGTADRVLYEMKRLPRKGMHSRNSLMPD
jgi:diguanylate cyclase (GGDEF)-like protein